MASTTNSQRAKLLAVLRCAHGAWVPLPEIQAAAGSQHGARIYELRRLGHRIENKPGGGWFRLLPPSLSLDSSQEVMPIHNPVPAALFPDMAVRHRDE